MERVLNIVVMEPEEGAIAAPCGCCGFESLLPFPLFSLDEHGVAPAGFYVACVRCSDMGCQCTRADI